MPIGEQIAILYCGTHNLLHEVPLNHIAVFQERFLDELRTLHQTDVIDVLASGEINDEVTTIIRQFANEIVIRDTDG